MVAGAASLYVIRPDGSGRAEISVHGVPHPLFPDWIIADEDHADQA
jgi:hypothetical protein